MERELTAPRMQLQREAWPISVHAYWYNYVQYAPRVCTSVLFIVTETKMLHMYFVICVLGPQRVLILCTHVQ